MNITIQLQSNFSQVRLASAVLCMAFAAVSFNYVYLYLAEVYPTTMRNRVTAGCIAVAEVKFIEDSEDDVGNNLTCAMCTILLKRLHCSSKFQNCKEQMYSIHSYSDE